jgi:hypothetical protein
LGQGSRPALLRERVCPLGERDVSAKTKRTTCPGSGNAPERVLRRAERVLIADRLSVHRGKAVCPVCGRQVGLNMSGLLTAHADLR